MSVRRPPAETGLPGAKAPPAGTTKASLPLRRPQVYLVGAGPGDPDLISVRGLSLLRRADVVLFDRLVDPSLLSQAPARAKMVYVGKRTADHTVPQADINQLLLEHAEEGKIVVRLKGGDPFIFGRGGEEALELQAAGIPFEVVPGISSGYGVPAYAGIPVTFRGVTSHVTFLTGHEDPTKDSAQIDWDRMASDVGTLVIFMGVKNLPHVVEELKRRGRPGDTPVALIRYGTLPSQETVVGVLDDIVEKVAAAKLRPPAITVIGEVVNLREKLHWFEDRPLFGLTIAVTRPRLQAAGQIDRLRELGARVIAFPTIRIEQVTDSPEIAAMLAAIESYDLLILTSVNAVEGFFDRLRSAGGDARLLHRAKVIAVGPKTAAACRRCGVVPDLLPDTFMAEGVVAALESSGLLPGPGRRVLIPRARKGREVLPEALTAAGAQVDTVPLYDTVLEQPDSALLEEVLGADLVSFTSSSSAENFASLIRSAGYGARLPEVRAASIGPATTETVIAEGMRLMLEAQEYTVEGLVDAIVHGTSQEKLVSLKEG